MYLSGVKKTVAVVFILCTQFLFGQNPLVKQWDHRFGGSDDERLASSFQQTSDGGYILGGSSISGNSGDKTQDNWDPTYATFDYWIVKLNALGIKQWDKVLGGLNNDWCTSLQQTSDRGYIFGGWSMSDSGGDKTQNTFGGMNPDYWIVKSDSLGNKLWDKDFGGSLSDYLSSIIQTKDGGYLLGGISSSGISGDKTQASWGQEDYWIIKTDALGNKQWDKDFGGTNFDRLHSLRQTSDGGYILGGDSFSGISGDKTESSRGSDDYWIVKIDSLGNKEWDKSFGGTGGDYLNSLIQTNDRGYMLGGISNSDSSGDKTQPRWGINDYWIVKTDSLGNKLWDKDFGGTDDESFLGNILQTSDGGFVMAGLSGSNISGDKTENNLGLNQTWVVKTNSSGIKQWDRTFLINGKVLQGFIVQTEGCYVVADENNGTIGGDKSEDSWAGTLDYWIIKLCEVDSVNNILQSPLTNPQLLLTPNPTTSLLTLRAGEIKIEKVGVYNMLGEEVMNVANITHGFNRGALSIDISQLPPGIYIVQATAGEKVWRGKVVKE